MDRIRVMVDYECYPVWVSGDQLYDNVSPSSLPISSDLASRLDSWGMEYTDTLNRDDPASSGFETKTAERDFVSRGFELARRLQRELGPEAQVTYFDELKRQHVSPDAESGSSGAPWA